MKSLSLHTTAVPQGVSDGWDDHLGSIVDARAILPGLLKRPEAAHAGDAILVPDRIPPTSTQRLVVFVPDGEMDDHALARRVWQLAAGSGLNVLYLALNPSDPWGAYQRRRLYDLAFMTSGNDVRAQAIVSEDQNWLRAFAGIQRPGDLAVCLEGHRVAEHILGRRPLGELLVESAELPVYSMRGVKIGLALHQQQRAKEIQGWMASIVLIAAFFGLQVAIDQSSSGMASTFMLCLSIFVEFFLLWKINEWIG
jgi:hypothetical protein